MPAEMSRDCYHESGRCPCYHAVHGLWSTRHVQYMYACRMYLYLRTYLATVISVHVPRGQYTWADLL